MEIEYIVLIDGTTFKMNDYRYGGTIKRIYIDPKIMGVYVQIKTKEKKIFIPFHSVLFYIIKEQDG